jgi:hypothetical protein
LEIKGEIDGVSGEAWAGDAFKLFPKILIPPAPLEIKGEIDGVSGEAGGQGYAVSSLLRN